jgi:hypothetical protein
VTAPRILPENESDFWRKAYLEAFCDTTSAHYQEHVATLKKCSDGLHYWGYIWDCLRGASRITLQRLRNELALHLEVFVMADDHSRDKIPGAPLWPYPRNSVAVFQSSDLLQAIDSLPEDFYVFDSSLTWTVVQTHEDDGKRRWCMAVGIDT